MYVCVGGGGYIWKRLFILLIIPASEVLLLFVFRFASSLILVRVPGQNKCEYDKLIGETLNYALLEVFG